MEMFAKRKDGWWRPREILAYVCEMMMAFQLNVKETFLYSNSDPGESALPLEMCLLSLGVLRTILGSLERNPEKAFKLQKGAGVYQTPLRSSPAPRGYNSFASIKAAWIIH